MRWLRFVVLIVAVAVLQLAFLEKIAFTDRHIKPDLLLALVVFFSICGISEAKQSRLGGWEFNVSEAVITSFAIGLIADITAHTLGPRIISYGVIGSLLAHLHRLVSARRITYQAIIIFATSILAGTLVALLTVIQRKTPTQFKLILWTSLYSAIVGPFFFVPAAWWMNIKTRRFSKFL